MLEKIKSVRMNGNMIEYYHLNRNIPGLLIEIYYVIYEREPVINFIFVGLDKSDAIAILDEIKSHNIIKYIKNRCSHNELFLYILKKSSANGIQFYDDMNVTSCEDKIYDILSDKGVEYG